MSTAGTAERLDAAIAEFLSSWNLVTSLLALVLVAFLLYPILAGSEPDIHPFLLARQAQMAPIRHQGESAVYRAIDIPHGYPLRAGLGVKDPGAPRWSGGRPGDLRDVWRAAVRGPVKDDGASAGERGKVMTVLGTEAVTETGLSEVTAAINTIGQYVKRNNGQSVAICLSNSVELLSAIFAGSFYGFSTTLLPYGLAPDKLNSLLSKTSADHVIAEAGVLNLEALHAASKSIKQVILVTQTGSQHMDWSTDLVAGLTVNSWQGLLEKNQRSSNSEVLPLDHDSAVPPVSIYSPTPAGGYELVKYTSENLISGTAALQATLVRSHKFASTDLVFLTTSLTDSYTLCWTMAALYSGASLCLNSVAGDHVDLLKTVSKTKPTVVVAASPTVQAYLTHPRTRLPAGLSKYLSSRALNAGTQRDQAASIPSLSRLRLLLIPQSATHDTKSRMSSSTLHTLLIHLKCRVGYGLTAPTVAGAISQTNILDYRDKGPSKVCVGAPLSSVEVNVTGDEQVMGLPTPRGKLSVKGPAVVGGKTSVDVELQIDEDHTLLLV